ncbi:hypothetical protein D9619_012061 [Psilocybe cf. subviscida]|uniref:Uncharacterized protein n=1 Tax=Psilocybe cf. subviscida TaxID=2480587 RepID=A0A8H5B8Y3_9AGAR|nr:hypothetical protein D9619_012061 [Psilocybe cf. subviscida]
MFCKGYYKSKPQFPTSNPLSDGARVCISVVGSRDIGPPLGPPSRSPIAPSSSHHRDGELVQVHQARAEPADSVALQVAKSTPCSKG